MRAIKANSGIRDLTTGIVHAANSSAGTGDRAKARRELRTLAQLDYGEALGRLFNRQQVLGLLKCLRSFLPELNRELFSETDLRRLAKRAKTFGAELQLQTFEGEEGRALRGFYLNDRSLLKHPLIVLNAADHRVGVAAAFWHEMGHHLTHAIFGVAHDRVSLSLNSVYGDHLGRPEEIVADWVTALACYPAPTARRLFGRKNTAGEEEPGLLFSKARLYLRDDIGIDIGRESPADENLRTLAGMIHLVKLRQALLREYGI